MKTSVLKVTGMSCDHCIQAITKALLALGCVTSVSVSLSEQSVTVEHHPTVPVSSLAAAIEGQGFDVIK